uniref:Uncharacterized protein n=1 Tax=Spongospora subterranea TaxID=70186 RepID=A0A0H5QZ83_9EUKA|eukprot:CRZ06995.1 hypothetical protein [Spongospora subterranea]
MTVSWMSCDTHISDAISSPARYVSNSQISVQIPLLSFQNVPVAKVSRYRYNLGAIRHHQYYCATIGIPRRLPPINLTTFLQFHCGFPIKQKSADTARREGD